ncbi:hypothetical protein HPB50_002362 [Hyalomma asiaticum]|uniref:Uncharacterized protein n=1 Tax=Hyalomma asiaticum TaxID=266040 RepID=A0ACB7TD50_HYAAI|nr:hypothetical protein HPB50_002362 [Hyalomma asiaticum]
MSHALHEISVYCLEELKFRYVLLGKFQTDILEDRFGKYRQLSGAQYHISIGQIYESENKLRLQKVLDLPDLDKLKAVDQKPEEEIKEILEDKAAIITALDEDMEKRPPAPKKEELSKADLADIEDALEKIAAEKQELLIEKEELEDLKEEMADYKQDVEELKDVVVKTGKRDIQETKAAMRLYNRVNRIIGSMDHLIDKLNEERKSMQIKLDSSEDAASQKTKDNLIEINDLLLAMRRIQKSSSDTRLEMITDLLDTLDIDHDGAVKIDHVLKVIDTLGRENFKVSPAQMKEIIELLIKEEVLQAKNKEQQAASADGATQPPSSNKEQQEKKNT